MRSLDPPDDLDRLRPWGQGQVRPVVEREIFHVWRVPAQLDVPALELGWVPHQHDPQHGEWACGARQPGLCRSCGTIRTWSLVPWLTPGPWLGTPRRAAPGAPARG